MDRNNLLIFLIFLLIESFFLFSFFFSIFFMVFQSLLFNLFFLSFFVNILNKKEGSKLKYFDLHFIPFYIIYETAFFSLFFIFYFFNIKSGFILVCLFKQGTFPFIIYNFIFEYMTLKYQFIKNYLFIFLFLSKIWVLLSYTKVVFCLDFYCYCVFLNMVIIFFNFSGDIFIFLGLGISFSNISNGIFFLIFNISTIILYSVIFLMFYRLSLNCIILYGRFIGNDLRFFYSLLFGVVNGIPLTFLIIIKFIFVIIIGNYSFFLICIYFFLSSLFFFYSFILFLNIFKGDLSIEVKLDFLFLLIFLSILIWLYFIVY